MASHDTIRVQAAGQLKRDRALFPMPFRPKIAAAGGIISGGCGTPATGQRLAGGRVDHDAHQLAQRLPAGEVDRLVPAVSAQRHPASAWIEHLPER